ncbi:XRE family transcriptional regulator [Leptospira sarikeiensis]|uniref:XRE family transcriptional regulator n=1 Tax=Leptospira sarikeiensis TaxID=2484943 RepID=A0A4V3JSI7_9LEPT|nr:XRE family transcriptional regulator [Leptospira sarikeiensis]
MDLESYQKNFRKKLGAKIKQLRLEKNITQEGMEDGPYGLSWRTFVEIERGNSNATINSIIKIALHLGVKPKDLLDI